MHTHSTLSLLTHTLILSLSHTYTNSPLSPHIRSHTHTHTLSLSLSLSLPLNLCKIQQSVLLMLNLLAKFLLLLQDYTAKIHKAVAVYFGEWKERKIVSENFILCPRDLRQPSIEENPV